MGRLDLPDRRRHEDGGMTPSGLIGNISALGGEIVSIEKRGRGEIAVFRFGAQRFRIQVDELAQLGNDYERRDFTRREEIVGDDRQRAIRKLDRHIERLNRLD
jgi:hypothetical protein